MAVGIGGGAAGETRPKSSSLRDTAAGVCGFRRPPSRQQIFRLGRCFAAAPCWA